MMTTYFGKKPFEPSLVHNDEFAKNVVIDFLLQRGFSFKVDPLLQVEKYSAYDLESISADGLCVKIEIERKRVWRESGKFESSFYPWVDWPARKKKTESDIAIMINNPGDTLLVFKSLDVIGANIVSKNTTNQHNNTHTVGEDFLRVHIDRARMFCKKDGQWVCIKGKN